MREEARLHVAKVNSGEFDRPKLFGHGNVTPVCRVIINTIASIWGENMLGYNLSLHIICSSAKLTVFLELCSRKTVRFSEQTMSADKYPSIFSPQMEAIVYISRVGKTLYNSILSSNRFLKCFLYVSYTIFIVI